MSFPSRLTQDALFCFLFPVSRGTDDLPNRISVATSQDDFFGFVRFDFCFQSILTFRPALRTLSSLFVISSALFSALGLSCQFFVSRLKSVCFERSLQAV